MSLDEFLAEWNNGDHRLLVHTSGSTGMPKPLWVEKSRMEASARMTCDFLGLREGDRALLCLPLDYIAGKMMVVRSLVRKLELVSVEPCGHPLESPLPPLDFAAMVPLQVWNSLQVPKERERLMNIRHLIIGGGPIDDALADALKDFPNAVWSTYGMTETLSHVALRRLNGTEPSEWYTPFDGVEVSLNEDGCLVINAPYVCNGPLTTNDIAELQISGDKKVFRILGRRDNVICSGGIKIQAEEVERLLGRHLSSAFMITKCRDEKFGECVVLLTEGDVEDARRICEQVLPKHWRPRHYLHVAQIPTTETGKPSRVLAQQIAEELVENIDAS
ncbi:MAG: AMP-binding protein [Prevotella sp.]|nr:AMP-binding protein [Prevotella sp.]